eukprot:6490886-Amphidinium_carterae.2
MPSIGHEAVPGNGLNHVVQRVVLRQHVELLLLASCKRAKRAIWILQQGMDVVVPWRKPLPISLPSVYDILRELQNGVRRGTRRRRGRCRHGRQQARARDHIRVEPARLKRF